MVAIPAPAMGLICEYRHILVQEDPLSQAYCAPVLDKAGCLFYTYE